MRENVIWEIKINKMKLKVNLKQRNNGIFFPADDFVNVGWWVSSIGYLVL